ncbi:MAG: aminodeoxychorismate/anthranilate synthase component II [Acetobacteraceae bacterium]|nr:aminodeoxychorismate/anthranilate synthase component II [Acetobacteraceae bacterium]
MILLIDNFDSFTFNLYHYLGEVLAARGQWRDDAILVRRNDTLTPEQALALNPLAIVLSPGPCTPDQAGICLALIREAAGRVPVLGVCLGHQAIGQAFGARVGRAPLPMHGKVGVMHHRGTGILAGLPNPFRATRYHSLVVERDSLPSDLLITAWNDDGLVMGMAHRALPIWGVQFHPESIASEHGKTILGNFLDLARGANLLAAEVPA